jgi:hypothetical protein
MECKRWTVCFLATLVFCWSRTLPAYSAGDVFEQASLRSLTPIQVVVEDLAPDLTQEGLDRTQLKLDVERQLQQAGIQVEQQAEHALYIHLGTQRHETGFYGYALSLQLLQLVLLFRDPSIVTWGTTWSIDQTGVIASSEIRDIAQMITRSVNAFIEDYRTANPPT